jgi:DnaJ-class molecular chaperone
MRDPYAVLGVQKTADQHEIKTAWRTLAKTLHPDQNPSDPKAVSRFTEAGRAYDILKDPEKRRRFDQAQARASAKGGKETTFMEARAERARAEAEARAAAAAAAAAARDAAADETDEAVSKIFGARKEGAQTAGTARGGFGEDMAQAERNDSRTRGDRGSGPANARPSPALELISHLIRRFTRQTPAPDKAPDLSIDVPVSLEDLMNRANPTVTLPDGKLLSVTLPDDAENGAIVRIEGYGHRLPGMKRGDVVATLRLRPHNWFTAEGHDLRTFHDIDIENAVLGCETMVETLNGPERISVPEWTGSGHVIKIPGYGLPKGNGMRGDLFVEMRVKLWDHPDQKVIDLMRSLREGLFL